MEASTSAAKSGETQPVRTEVGGSEEHGGIYRLGLPGEVTKGADVGERTLWLAEARGADQRAAINHALDAGLEPGHALVGVKDQDRLADVARRVDAGELVELEVVAVRNLSRVPVQVKRERRIG